MKKFLLSMLSVFLLLALMTPALAWSQMGVTMQDVKAYSDSGRTKYVATIPKNTVVRIDFPDQYYENDAGSFAVYAGNDKHCFVRAAEILDPIGVTLSEGPLYSATLKKNARVYQRPTKKSNSIRIKKAVGVVVCYVKGNWALIYRDSGNYFGFVNVKSLKNVKKR